MDIYSSVWVQIPPSAPISPVQTCTNMNVFLDTISGEEPSQEIIKGALEALSASNSLEITLVGDEKADRAFLENSDDFPSRISFLDAPQTITMKDDPVSAVRRNPNSSLVQGCKASKEREGVFISPGNTGAVVAAALFNLGRIEGVKRPGLSAVIPTLEEGNIVLIDVGATTDATPLNLCQFAVMGEVFARHVLSVEEPKVGLLNIGEESNKGNKLTKKTSEAMGKLDLDYRGNIEPHSILSDPPADVIVCDGFVGNVLLKSFEGAARSTIGFFKRALSKSLRSKLGGLLLKPTFRELKKQLSFSNFGAVPLLGIDGIVFVGHGRSQARAIRNAVLNAERASKWGLTNEIKKAIEEIDECILS